MRILAISALFILAGTPSGAHADPLAAAPHCAIPTDHPHRSDPGDQQQRGERDQGRDVQTERLTRTVRIGANGELDVANIAGDITVTRGGGAEATIEMVKTARAASASEAREMLGLVQVDVNERDGRAELRTRYPNGDNRRSGMRRNLNVSVAYTIVAPAAARVTAKSISGDVTVRDIKGDLALESVSGDILVAGGARVSSIKTISGDVTIEDTDADGALDASSVSGTVSVRRLKARSLTLGAVSGDIVAEDIEAGRADLQTVSGDVRWSGTLAQAGRYDFTSHSGDIQVRVGSDRGFEVDANSFSGTIRSDLALTGQTASRERERGGRRTLRGTFGNGSAVLDITTFSGDILITKR